MSKKHIFKDNESIVEAFGQLIYKEVSKAESFHISLSGGTTPTFLFEYLAKEYKDKMDWKKVHLYWGDERCVPPTDPQSNYGVVFEKLLQHIKIPAKNVNRIKGENDPKKEALRYASVLRRKLPRRNNIPIFDFVLLGMGGDGHTASIFPHQMELLSSKALCAVATHPESGQKRISLTGRIINAAKSKHFLVTGKSKTAMLANILLQKEGYLVYPAAHIQGANWWMDDLAASDRFPAEK